MIVFDRLKLFGDPPPLVSDSNGERRASEDKGFLWPYAVIDISQPPRKGPRPLSVHLTARAALDVAEAARRFAEGQKRAGWYWAVRWGATTRRRSSTALVVSIHAEGGSSQVYSQVYVWSAETRSLELAPNS